MSWNYIGMSVVFCPIENTDAILKSLDRKLQDVLDVVRELASRSRWRRILYHEVDKQKIASCKESIRLAMEQFQVILASQCLTSRTQSVVGCPSLLVT